MSFVGPRPALYNQHDLINLRKRKNIDQLMPGLTGWAQINSAPVRYNLGYFAEDYVYIDEWGHLDHYNGRCCVTPEFPEGRYCYFSTIESTTPTYGGANNGAYPYIAGVDMYHRFYEENRLRASELRDKIIFNDPPLKYTDPINGQVNVQRFRGRLFSFVDDNNLVSKVC